MQSSEMIEKVARAIAAEYHIDPDALGSGQIPQFLSHPRLGVHGAHLKFRDEDYMPIWRLFVPQARAAILAMRDPTQEMRGEGHLSLHGNTDSDGSFEDDAEKECWQAMIDEALK